MSDIRLVLLSCCAPCSTGAIRQLMDILQPCSITGSPLERGGSVADGVWFPDLNSYTDPSARGEQVMLQNLNPKQLIDKISDFIVLFYNPNVYPESEYQKRLAEQIKYCDALGIKYATTDYNHDDWLGYIRGHESATERGARCALCFEYRFKFGADWAAAHGYNAIASVLGISRHKNQHQVDAAARTALQGRAIKYLPIKWDMNLHAKINRESDFYRQNYCGCEFSQKFN